MTTPAERGELQRLFAWAHPALVLILVATRPLIWDGDPGAPALLAWQGLLALALALTVVESAAGLRPRWNWSWGGVLGAACLVLLAIAAWRARAPVPAAGLWFGWVSALGLGMYLAQIVPRHTGAVVAGLLAAFAGQAVFVGAQYVWVIPAIAAANAAGDASVASVTALVPAGSLAERLVHGGCFGTFTLANTLAVWTAVLALVLAAAAWPTRRALAWTISLAALLMLLAAGAKGVVATLTVGATAAWWWHAPRWRWAAPLLGTMVLAALVLWPGITGASGAVRLGYWAGAWDLIRERPLSGLGLDGFATHYPRVMGLAAEPTRLAHNEVIEALVAGGVLTGLAVAGWLAWLAQSGRRRTEPVPDPLPPAAASAALTWWPLLAAVPYAALLGAFDTNLGWWPGQGVVPGMLLAVLWSVPLAGVMAACAQAGRSLDPGRVAPWVWSCAFATAAAHTLIDFDLHGASHLCTLVALLAIAPGAWRSVSLPPVLPAAALAGLIAIGMWIARDGLRLRQAEDLLAEVRLLPAPQDPRHDEALAWLVQRAGLAEAETTADAGARRDAVLVAIAAASAGDPALATAACSLRRPSPAALAACESLAAAQPHLAGPWSILARQRAAAGDARGAFAAADAARALTPRSVGAWRRAAALARAAATGGDGRDGLLAEAERLEREADRLETLVHPTNRSGVPPR